VRYGVALLCVSVAVVARQLLDPSFHDQLPFLTFFPAVALSAAFGGLGPGIFATAVGYLAADYCFIPPRGHLTLFDAPLEVLVSAGTFFAVGLVIAQVSESALRASRRAAESRRQAEEKASGLEVEMRRRQESDERFRIALKNSPVTVFSCDRDLRYTWVANPPPGFRPEDILGKRADDILGPEMAAELVAFQRRVIETGEGGSHQFSWFFGGEQRWHDVIAEPMRNETGAVVGLTAAAVDVTAHALSVEVQATLAAILESSDDGIVGKNLQGTIISWNAGAERVFGYPASEAIGQSITMLLPPDRLEEERGIIAKLCVGERIDHFETVRRRKDGELIDVSISVSPIKDASGRIVGAAKIARDVTLRKRTDREREELLQRAEEARLAAEAASQAKDVFLATVSHELRTPLSPILAWSTMLRRGRVPGDKAMQAYETIERCARSQSQLIEDLLDVAGIVSGKMHLRLAPVDLESVIQAAVDVVRPAAEAKGIRIDTVLDTAVGPVSGDRDRLQQVVWNLLSNAIKFTPRGGRVHVALERVDSHVEIAVSDTGKGIAPAFLPYMFSRFTQADSGPRRASGGLGLGLAIARHIVELHGGTIHAESGGEGQGAAFTVKLPLMVVARPAAGVEHRKPSDGGEPRDVAFPRLDRLSILLVDDEPDSNEVIRAVLASCGAEVRAANSVDQALAELNGWTPDVLVSDIGMPEKDGYELISALRTQDGPLRTIPAIALTAYASVDDRVRLLAAGFQTHVPKPVEPIELVTVIANAARAAGKT
jgi:PAS domain S-box-containing protein